MSETENQTVNQNEKTGFYSKKFKAQALSQLSGRWTIPVVVTLIVTAIELVLICAMFPWEFYIGFIKTALNGSSGPDMSLFPFARYSCFMLMTLLISPVLNLALLSLFPVLYKTKEPLKFSEFVSGLSLWGKALGAFFWKVLWLWLWELAGMLIGIVLGLVIGGISYAVTKESMVLAATIPICIYIPIIVIIVIKAYEYSLMEFAIVDNDEIKVKQAMEISKKLTKGYKWKLFCLDLSFIGWSILASLVSIGNLWLVPYQTAAKFSAYRYLLDEFNKNMEAQIAAAPTPKAIEDEPVSAEVDTSDGNEC